MIPSLVDVGTKEIFKYVASKIKNEDILVELGVFVGGSIISLLNSLKEEKKTPTVYAIDNFQFSNISEASLKEGNTRRDNGYETFVNNLNISGNSCKILISDTVEASKHFIYGTVNFIFHDANHGYGGVLAELQAWKPKLSERCLVMIHDWPSEGIQNAVKEIWGEPIKVVDNGATAILKDTL